MKRVLLVVLLLSTLSFIPAAPAGAAAEAEAIPVNTVVSPCEHPIHITGTVRKVTISNVTPDGRVIFATKYSYGGIRGTDDAGNVYRAAGVERQIDVFSGVVYTTTFVSQFQWVGQGGSTIYRDSLRFHLTVGPNRVTALSTRSEVTCP
jgi:hypothetical protein